MCRRSIYLTTSDIPLRVQSALKMPTKPILQQYILENAFPLSQSHRLLKIFNPKPLTVPPNSQNTPPPPTFSIPPPNIICNLLRNHIHRPHRQPGGQKRENRRISHPQPSGPIHLPLGIHNREAIILLAHLIRR